MQNKNKIDPEEITQALLDGFEDGIIWEYDNDYTKGSPLWIEYFYGYIIGFVMPEKEDA